MNDLDAALQDVVSTLDALACPYAVMGGLAVRTYGIPRPTRDVDVTVSIDRSRLPELFESLEAKGYTTPEAYQRGWVDEIAGMPLVKLRTYHSTGGVDVDLFLAESEFQRSLIARRRPTPIEDRLIDLVSPEDLVLLKLLAGRPRDRADVGDVLFVQGKLDQDYLRLWAERLGVADELASALAEAGS